MTIPRRLHGSGYFFQEPKVTKVAGTFALARIVRAVRFLDMAVNIALAAVIWGQVDERLKRPQLEQSI